MLRAWILAGVLTRAFGGVVGGSIFVRASVGATVVACLLVASGQGSGAGPAAGQRPQRAVVPAKGTPRKADAVEGTTSVGVIGALGAYIGLTRREDGSILAYVCDGKQISFWASGKPQGNRARLRPKEGPGQIDLALAQRGAATGTVTLPFGKPVSFSAVPSQGKAGLYRRETRAALTGWVVLADGRRKGDSQNGHIIDRDAVTLSTTGGNSTGLLTHWRGNGTSIRSELRSDLKNSGSGCTELRVTWKFDNPTGPPTTPGVTEVTSRQNCQTGSTINVYETPVVHASDWATAMTVGLYRNGQLGESRNFFVGDADDSNGTCDQLDIDNMTTVFQDLSPLRPKFTGTATYTCNRSVVDGTLSFREHSNYVDGCVNCWASVHVTWVYVDGHSSGESIGAPLAPREACIQGTCHATSRHVHAEAGGVISTTVFLHIHDSRHGAEKWDGGAVTKNFGDGG